MWASLKSALAPQPDKRRAQRESASGSVRIDSRTYPIVNWSATGVLIGGHRDHLAKGQRFRMNVAVDDGQEPIEFSAEGVVVRVQGDKLAAQFFQIEKHKKAQIHRYFARRANSA